MGGVVCWYIHKENRNAEVGHRLGSASTEHGLATRSGKAVLEYLFEVHDLHRIEMQCGVANVASRAVAERCGLTQEGTGRESYWITDGFVDHVLYSILAKEWAAKSPAM